MAKVISKDIGDEARERSMVKKLPLAKVFPDGFDETNPDDMKKLTVKIQEFASTHKGFDDYALYRVDNEFAFIAPADYTPGGDDGSNMIGLDIDYGRERAAQKKTVKDLENKNRGWTVTEFVFSSYHPEKVYVRMEQLDDKTLYARQQFAAALSVEPWEIRVTKASDGGWRIQLSDRIAYVHSRYDSRMQETVETVGAPGWFFNASPKKRLITVHPGELPTFPPSIPYPRDAKPDLKHLWFGMKLPDPGRETGELTAVNLKTGPGILVAAATNNGKSVVINSVIASALMAGCDVVICDTLNKSVDFEWCRDWVLKWGCDSPEANGASLQWVMDECNRRAEIIRRYKVESWFGLPDEERAKMPFILVVGDELAQWAGSVTIPKADKNSPTRIAKEYEANIHAFCQDRILKITQTARFTGIGFLFAAQSVRLQDGLDPGVRTNLTTVISPGRSTDRTVEERLGGSKALPAYPDYIEGQNAVGMGYTSLSGNPPCIYKGFYEEEPGRSYSQILRDMVMAVRPVDHDENRGRWSWSDIVRLVPEAADKPDEGSSREPDDHGSGDGFPTDGFGEDGRDVADRDKPLRGAAAAAHASKLYAAATGADAFAEMEAIARQSAARGL